MKRLLDLLTLSGAIAIILSLTACPLKKEQEEEAAVTGEEESAEEQSSEQTASTVETEEETVEEEVASEETSDAPIEADREPEPDEFVTVSPGADAPKAEIVDKAGGRIYVQSPYSENPEAKIDVTDNQPGDLVQDPYTKKFFVVP